MNISGKVLYEKVQYLRPDLSSAVKPEILDKLCDDPAVQPFLKWFCGNVTSANVLTNEEVQIKNKLEKSGRWMKGPDLDNALRDATRDYPQVLNLVTFDRSDVDDFYVDFKIIKSACEEDEDYINTLKNSIKDFKRTENKLDEDIEVEETLLAKARFETEKIYNDCATVMKKFDADNRIFSKNIEHLLNIYADAAENKGLPILWTQMPIELFVKQMELYNDTLAIHVRRQFENEVSKNTKQECDSDYDTLINLSKNDQIDDKIQELMSCNTKLTISKMNEINAIVQEIAWISTHDYAQDIYNDGNLKIPYKNRIQDEILELTRKRDFLEENKLLQERQLQEVAQRYAELEVTKVLKNDAYARLERRKIRLEKLKTLLSLAREHGHVHADLLCMLMQMQFHCLQDITEFVADARHFLTMEYSLSTMRSDSMQQQQNEYNAIISSKCYNSFDQLFKILICGDETDTDLFITALKKYNDIIVDNKIMKETVLETYLNSCLKKLEVLENDVNVDYIAELHSGPTWNFEPISHEISTQHSKVSDLVNEIKTDVAEIRNKLKTQMRDNSGLEREKKILWQWFLADTDTLRAKYSEAKEKGEQSHFGPY